MALNKAGALSQCRRQFTTSGDLYALIECERRTSLVRDGCSGSIHLHGVHQEAELVAQRLVAVRQPDLGHVGPPDVVALVAAELVLRHHLTRKQEEVIY